MSNRAARTRRRFAHGAVTGLTFVADGPAVPAELPSRLRRQIARQFKKDAARTQKRPITPSDIPPGSVLSDTTIAAIEAGEMAYRVLSPPTQQITRARETYAQKLRRRHLAKKSPNDQKTK